MQLVKNNKTVLVGMTGGIESTVAAYLLKKQGYRVIGIGLVFFEEDENPGPFSEYVIKDLNHVKKICNTLDIPFYAVNAVEQFRYYVSDQLVGRKLSGQSFDPSVYLHKIIFDVLLEKSEKLKAQEISSGHFAKVLKNQKTQTYELMVANDLENDQSYLLSRLEHKHLEKLILPLSEIRKTEVEKIGKLVGVQFAQRNHLSLYQVMQSSKLINFVEERSPKELRRQGTIYTYKEDNSLSEHAGIHMFYINQAEIEIKAEIKIPPEYQVISIVPYKGNIFVEYPDRLGYSHAFVSNLIIEDSVDISVPMSVYVKIGAVSEKLAGQLYFKNNRYAVFHFEETQKGKILPVGSAIVMYSRAKEKGKIIASGIVVYGGMFTDWDIHTLPKNVQLAPGEVEQPDPVIEKLRF